VPGVVLLRPSFMLMLRTIPQRKIRLTQRHLFRAILHAPTHSKSRLPRKRHRRRNRRINNQLRNAFSSSGYFVAAGDRPPGAQWCLALGVGVFYLKRLRNGMGTVNESPH
jgi:hypothetical protein